MRQATLLVIKKDYKGDTAIDNVIGYALDSYFADLDEVMLHNIRSDNYDHIVEDFYNAQSSLDMTNRKRLFHFEFPYHSNRIYFHKYNNSQNPFDIISPA